MTQDPFQHTLFLIQVRLNSNLPDGIRKIWVEGNQSGHASICLTLFPNVGQYRFIFHKMKNFRNVKSDMDENTINSIISGYEYSLRNLI